MAYDWYLLMIVNSPDLADRLEVVFRFPSPILEKSITNAEGLEFGLEFDTEKVEDGIILKGFSIITPILTIKEADDFAQENANRIFV